MCSLGIECYSNMSVIMVRACVVWESYAVGHERHDDFTMCAGGNGCSGACTLLWFGHVCSGRCHLLAGWQQVMWKISDIKSSSLISPEHFQMQIHSSKNALLLSLLSSTTAATTATTAAATTTTTTRKYSLCHSCAASVLLLLVCSFVGTCKIRNACQRL